MYVVKHIPSYKKVCHHAGQSYNIKSMDDAKIFGQLGDNAL